MVLEIIVWVAKIEQILDTKSYKYYSKSYTNMKIFDDPINKIPPICENDINDKIIISYKITKNSIICNFIKRDDDGIFRGRGVMTSHKRQWTQEYVTVWTDSYNKGISLMNLIEKEYKRAKIIDWKIKYYVIESYDDLMHFMNLFDITSNSKLGKALLEYWSSLQNNPKFCQE